MHPRARSGRRLIGITAVVLVTLGMIVLAAHAPAIAQALVVDGEPIADAALLAAARAEGALLVYTANFEDNERALLARFRDDTGIRSDMIRLGTGRLFERVLTEYAGKKLRADVIGLTDVDL